MYATRHHGFLYCFGSIGRCVYLVFLLICAPSVIAQAPASCLEYRTNSFTGLESNAGPWSVSPAAACEAGFSQFRLWRTTPTHRTCAPSGMAARQLEYSFGFVSNQCRMYELCPYDAGPATFTAGIASRTTTTCPCPEGQEKNAQGVCIPKVCPSALANGAGLFTTVIEPLTKAAADNILRSSTSKDAAHCVDNCIVRPGLAACGGKGDVWRCEFTPGKPTSTPCVGNGPGSTPNGGTFTAIATTAPTTGTTATNTQTAAPPGPGLCPGTINGVLVYVKCDAFGSNSTTTSTSTSGSNTNTVTTTKTTDCGATTCTTVTKTDVTVTSPNTASGTSGVTTSTTTGSNTSVQTKDEFCKANPLDTQCKAADKTSFGGSCAGSFTCDGDAATCAVAKATNELNCGIEIPAAGLDVLKRLDAGTFANPLGTTTRAISAFDKNGGLATGAIADQVMTLNGTSFTIPFSAINQYIVMMGQVLVMFTSISCCLLVAKGFV